MGQWLGILDGIANTDPLLDKIRRRDESAVAELVGLYLIRSGRLDSAVELEPAVGVAGRNKKPDFRLSLPGEPDTYVEVTQPSLSEDYEVARRILERIAEAGKEIKKAFALEVFLRRVPSTEEAENLMSLLPAFCTRDGSHRYDLNGMGFLLLNADSPGHIELRTHEENHPGIGMAQVITGQDEPHRHIAIRLAFSDERAQQFLETEAKQLPKESPGLIMVQMGHAPGGFRTWEPIIRRRLQPNLHTRVSAVCLFASGLHWTEAGEAWIPRTKLITNPHAKHPLPGWIGQELGRSASDW
jgi:hypothetical protein